MNAQPGSRRRAVLLAAVLGTVVLAAAAGLYLWGSRISPEAVRDALLQLGPLGPLVHILILGLVLTVPLVPATIFQVAGGWAFGPWLGFVYTMIGDALGAALGFWIARMWGDAVLRRWLSPASQYRVLSLAGRMSVRAVIVLRLLPGPAYTLVSLAAGLSPLSFRPYLLASLVGVAPWIVLLTLAGDVGRSNPWLGVGVVVAILVLAAALGRFAKQSRMEN